MLRKFAWQQQSNAQFINCRYKVFVRSTSTQLLAVYVVQLLHLQAHIKSDYYYYFYYYAWEGGVGTEFASQPVTYVSNLFFHILCVCPAPPRMDNRWVDKTYHKCSWIMQVHKWPMLEILNWFLWLLFLTLIFSDFGSVKKGAINSFRYHLTFHEHHQIYLLVRYKVPSISVCSCNANLH